MRAARLAWTVKLLLLGVVIYIVFFAALPRAQTVFTVAARTEAVTMTVVNEEASAFGLHRALLRPLDGEPVCLENVLVTPHTGATVRYTRFGRDLATIVISDSTADLVPLHAGVGMLPGWAGRAKPPVQLVLDPGSTCKPSATIRLPLFGVMEALGDEASFGQDPAEPRLALLSGIVRIFVRATDWSEAQGPSWLLDRPMGVTLGWFGLEERGELFSVAQTALPPGSVVRRARWRGRPADWWGFADIDFGDLINRGFDVEASSRASSLDVLLPATMSSHGEAEDEQHLSLTRVERVETDPELRLIAAVIAALIAFGEVYEKFLRHEDSKRSEEAK